MSHAVESAAGSHASASASITLGLLYRDGYRDLDTSGGAVNGAVTRPKR